MSRWYYWVSGFFVLDAMQAFGVVDTLFYPPWDGKPGDKITQTLNVLMILTSLVLFGRSYRTRRGVCVGGVLALAAIAFLFLTSLWSMDPGTTVREAVLYLFVIVGAIGIAGTLDADEYMDLLGLTCFLSAVASLALLAVSPSTAFLASGVDFQGIFVHKNVLGQVMVTGALASLHAIRVGGRRRARKIFMLFVFAGIAFASHSTTSLLTIIAFCCVDGIIALCRRGGAAQVLGVFFAIALAPILVVAVADPDPMLEMIGKDPTLTGRTEIWEFVINSISLKPLLGWGYFAFWLRDNPAAVQIANVMGFFVPEAHNGLLEMLVHIGVVGTAIFIFLFVRNVVLAFRCLRTSAKELAISTLMCCAGILLVGITETVLLAPTQSSTSVFFITGLLCEQAVRAAKRQQIRIGPMDYPRVVPTNSAT
jgi:O-antigen ligase